MTPRLWPEDVEAIAELTRTLGRVLTRDGIHALDVADALTERGYPTDVSADAATGAGPAIVVEDETGHPDRVPATAVEAAAILPRSHDERLPERLQRALDAHRTAALTLQAVLAETLLRGQREPRLNTVRRCANRACREVLEGLPHRRGRCLPCARHLDDNGRDAPARIIRERHRSRERRAQEAAR